ncbi:hypothetical protein CLAVI_000397 [Candidatus Clavichlamydia salmonicola]|uniref:hypothetical protein n=1 Tax=Candidatus Clavichlamydia salmonicola TaxID=469812 RepID=UPI001891F2B3|nr:hypothetical protein [Candidatus Clavichlamydia salmonicola]MBF5050778.1 hypothetical protein [Candidatus Clavichlamydia salmonicola]
MNPLNCFSSPQNQKLSFFKDTLVFSKNEKFKSLHTKILANLELWLNSTPRSIQGRIFEVSTFNNNNLKKKTLTLSKGFSSPLSSKQKTIFFILKIVATILIFPRLIAELLRYKLRSYLFLTQKDTLIEVNFPEERSHNKLSKETLTLFLTEHTQKNIETEIQKLKEKILSHQAKNIISYLPSHSPFIRFQLKEYPNLIFTTHSHAVEDESISPFQEILTMTKDINTVLTQHDTKSFFAIPALDLTHINNSPGLLSYIIEEKIFPPKNHNYIQWKNQESHIIPILVAFARLLFTTDIEYKGCHHFPLIVDKDNCLRMVLDITQQKTPDPIDYRSFFKRMVIFFKDLHTSTCMDAIITALVEEQVQVNNFFINNPQYNDSNSTYTNDFLNLSVEDFHQQLIDIKKVRLKI